jgi:AraC family transcriptional regulator
MNRSSKEAVGLSKSGFELYGAQGLLRSSKDLGWSGIAAELRTHTRGEIQWKLTQPETEVCVAISPSNARVTRSGAGLTDCTFAQRGTIWWCPADEHRIEFSGSVAEILHIYLPAQSFSTDSLGIDAGPAAHTRAHYERGFQDPLVAEIAFAIVSELHTQTAGGKLLAETLAVSLAARLMQRHGNPSHERDFAQPSGRGLNRRRLTLVKEYIAANLESDLTITQLAKVASLSRFHFARAFKTAVGQSPHRYVSAHRLERAKELLRGGERSLLDIAIALNFSTQGNFTRAFHQSTGLTPGQYRRASTGHRGLSS